MMLSFSVEVNMVDHNELLNFARRMPLRDPAVKEMLLQWMDETRVTDPEAPSIDLIKVAIKHTLMKYGLGFISKEQALIELDEEGCALASEVGNTSPLLVWLLGEMKKVEVGVDLGPPSS